MTPVVKKEKEVIALFIDGANMFFAQKKMGEHIDYRKLYNYFAANSSVYRAIYYTGERVPVEVQDQKFFEWLISTGFKVVRKPVKKYMDHLTGQQREECNLDVEIAVDILLLEPFYDRAILFSGDGDFVRVLEALRYRGKKADAVALRSMTSLELINACDHYYDLSAIVSHVRKRKKSRAEDFDRETPPEETASEEESVTREISSESDSYNSTFNIHNSNSKGADQESEPRPHPEARPEGAVTFGEAEKGR